MAKRTRKCRRGASANCWPPSEGRAVILRIPSIASRMKMICAALQAHQPLARTSTRTPTRTSFSQGRPLHPKWRAHHFAWSRTPFCQSRTSFGPEAQVILMRALAWAEPEKPGRNHNHLLRARRYVPVALRLASRPATPERRRGDQVDQTLWED